MRRGFMAAMAAVGCAVGAGRAVADDTAAVQVILRDHRFIPAEIHVVSGRPNFIEITNADSTPEEFESGVLAIEKIVPASGRVRVRLRPLAPGRFPFFGEFHQDTAQGVIVADAIAK